MQDKLKNIEKFFKYNLEIKKLLHSTIPKEEYAYNTDSLIEYVDKLESALNDIEYYINVILDNFNFSKEDKQYFNNFIKVVKKELINYGYDYKKIKDFHKVVFSNMTESLINEVGSNCVGYSMFNGISLVKGKSINEILHIVHQTIINNESNYKGLPIISKKQNEEGYDITLYGNNSQVASNIFTVLPKELSSGDIDIMSLNNDKVIIMARDLGHALVVEIEKENEMYYVNYFIPKICNVDMVNNLKGVKKVTNESNYTVGNFATDLNGLSMEILNLLSSVPMDKDMFIEGGKFYNGEENKKI